MIAGALPPMQKTLLTGSVPWVKRVGQHTQCIEVKMFGGETKQGSLLYIEGTIETTQGEFTLRQSGLKMTGISLIPG